MGKFNSLNKAEFIGRLGKDAEVRHTPSGQMVASFNIAVDRKDTSNGAKDAEWVRCSLWGENAVNAYSPYLTKGTLVFVDGRPSASAWIGKEDGQAHAQLELSVNTVQLLGGKNGAVEDAPAEEIEF